MGYGVQVLDRPAGTYAFQPGIMEQISPLMQAGGQGIADMIYRKAAEKAGLEPSYKKDAEGNWITSYEKPSNSSLDAINKIFSLKKNIKEAKIDEEAPRLANATNYFQKAIESGGDPAKLSEMVKPERFAYPEQQKEIRSAIEAGLKTKKESGPQPYKPISKADQLQFEGEKAAARANPKVEKPKTITPAQALNIISDPIKAQQFKKDYPEQYKTLEGLALNAMGSGDVTTAKPSTVKSPFKEYPDAFQENGVWKVMRNGQKYKIEG